MRIPTIPAVAASLAALAAPAAADTFKAPSEEYPTIQSAINAAGEGDKVVIGKGNHPESILIDGKLDFTIVGSGNPTLQGVTVQNSQGGVLRGFTVVEGTSCWAEPAGLIQRQTFETLRDRILGELQAALPVDAVVLGLHGAMVAQGYDDPEGDLLERVRALVGPDVLVAAEFDPHSHLTAKRVANLDLMATFLEFPHTDFEERGEHVVELALRTLRGGRAKGWATPRRLARVNELIEELMLTLAGGTPEEGAVPISVSFLLAPSPAKRTSRAGSRARARNPSNPRNVRP